MIKYVGDLKLLVTKYGFHKGYNQHNQNHSEYGVLETDNIRINSHNVVISVGSDLWISCNDYYHWGGLDKLYEMFLDGVVKKEDLNV